MKRLTVRVAWHDNRWNGTVCPMASKHSYCLDLDRIRMERDDDLRTVTATLTYLVTKGQAQKLDRGRYMAA